MYYSMFGYNDFVVIFNPRRACAARVTVVVGCVLSVCLSASYLTSRAINHSTNDTTYSASDECRQICGVSLKLLHSGVTA